MGQRDSVLGTRHTRFRPSYLFWRVPGTRMIGILRIFGTTFRSGAVNYRPSNSSMACIT